MFSLSTSHKDFFARALLTLTQVLPNFLVPLYVFVAQVITVYFENKIMFRFLQLNSKTWHLFLSGT
jgi:hypothetical protein